MILALSTPDKTTKAWLFNSPADAEALATLEWESGRALSDELLGRLTQLVQDHAASSQDHSADPRTTAVYADPASHAASTASPQDPHPGLHNLTGIIIFSGPGSFTSLRIGHTVANALADGLQIPVVGALGDNWLEQGKKKLADAKAGIPALPHYGADANITKPKS